MIQLATDPNARRAGWRAAPAEAKDKPVAARRGARSGHAWPFISQYDERAQQQRPRVPSTHTGS